MESGSGVYCKSGNELTKEEEKRLAMFDYVRYTVGDIHGIGRCKAVPRRQISSTLSRGGVDIYSGVLAFGPRSQITEMEEVAQVNYGNCVMVPMSGTLRALPWAAEGKFKVCEVLCETFWIKPFRDGTQQAACPRFLARKQLNRLDKMGYQILSGYEPEFTAFSRDTKKPLWAGNDIFSCRDFAEFESYVYFLDSGLAEVGANCGTLNTEYGPGQFEFPTAPKFGITSADVMFRVKQVIKEMSLQKDVDVTFMTQPILKSFNNGLHFSHSIWDKEGKVNAFHKVNKNEDRENQESHMSDILNRWLGGLLKHASALVALCCPTVNCYRRLGTPWAPGQADWGINDRARSIRIKVGDCEQMETYIENRIPSGAANPYIVLAATIAAGISGLSDPESTPPSPGTATPFPKTLGEALDALEKDDVMVESLGEEFIKWFCTSKRKLEVEPLKEADFDKEFEMYFKMI